MVGRAGRRGGAGRFDPGTRERDPHGPRAITASLIGSGRRVEQPTTGHRDASSGPISTDGGDAAVLSRAMSVGQGGGRPMPGPGAARGPTGALLAPTDLLQAHLVTIGALLEISPSRGTAVGPSARTTSARSDPPEVRPGADRRRRTPALLTEAVLADLGWFVSRSTASEWKQRQLEAKASGAVPHGGFMIRDTIRGRRQGAVCGPDCCPTCAPPPLGIAIKTGASIPPVRAATGDTVGSRGGGGAGERSSVVPHRPAARGGTRARRGADLAGGRRRGESEDGAVTASRPARGGMVTAGSALRRDAGWPGSGRRDRHLVGTPVVEVGGTCRRHDDDRSGTPSGSASPAPTRSVGRVGRGWSIVLRAGPDRRPGRPGEG